MKVGRLRIGLLAEDETDCDALAVLVRRMAREVSDALIGIDKHSTDGCGALRKKGEARMRQMANEGCRAAVMVHDLDLNPNNSELNSEDDLRVRLSRLAVPSGLLHLICIPVEEIEAWFWADPEVIRLVGRGKGRASPSPHLIKRPKEQLQRLSMAANGKPRYNTNDNAELAAKLDLALCSERCRAFRELREFIHRVISSSP